MSVGTLAMVLLVAFGVGVSVGGWLEQKGGEPSYWIHTDRWHHRCLRSSLPSAMDDNPVAVKAQHSPHNWNIETHAMIPSSHNRRNPRNPPFRVFTYSNAESKTTPGFGGFVYIASRSTKRVSKVEKYKRHKPLRRKGLTRPETPYLKFCAINPCKSTTYKSKQPLPPKGGYKSPPFLGVRSFVNETHSS